jgi:hypothetical protein
LGLLDAGVSRLMIKGIPFFQAVEVSKCSSCFDSAEIVALSFSRRDLVVLVLVLADMGKSNVVDRETEAISKSAAMQLSSIETVRLSEAIVGSPASPCLISIAFCLKRCSKL